MANFNEVTIKRANTPRCYRFIVDGVELRHVRDVTISMPSDGSRVEITLTLLATLVHAADEPDPNLDNATPGW